MKNRAAWSFLLLVACGGGSGTGPVSAETAEEYCRREAEHGIACCEQLGDCGGDDVESLTSDCVADVADFVREDWFTAAVDCAVQLECGVADDECFEPCEPTGAHEAFETRCREELSTCQTPEQVDQNCDTSFYFCPIASPIMDQMTACFDEDGCAAQIACVNSILSRGE